MSQELFQIDSKLQEHGQDLEANLIQVIHDVGLQRDFGRSVINRAKINLLNSFEKSITLPRSNFIMSRFSINDHVIVVTAQQVPVSGTIKWFGLVPTSFGDMQLVGIQTVSCKDEPHYCMYNLN